MPKHRNARWLQQKYWEEGLSLSKMALLAGVCLQTISNQMKKHAIPRRTLSEACGGKRHPMYGRRGKNNPNFGHKHSAKARRKMSKAMRGKKNPAWNGGQTYNPQGYILLKRPDHPHANNQGYMREHRLVIEEHLGRYLHPEEVIHHINGVRDDNRKENLMLFRSESEHQAFHAEIPPVWRYAGW